jgi:hypothetical protein
MPCRYPPVLHEGRDIGEGDLSRQPAVLEEDVRELLMVSASFARLEGANVGEKPRNARGSSLGRSGGLNRRSGSGRRLFVSCLR